MNVKKSGGARSNSSRAKEFDLIFGFLEYPKSLLSLLQKNPDGGREKLEGIVFEYGNVQRLVTNIKCDKPLRPFSFRPKFVVHIDHISAQRKKEIEIEFALKKNSISGQSSKVDLLVVDASGRPYFISFKDSDAVAKLGQVSRAAKYGDAMLSGGLGAIPTARRIPRTFSHKQTALTEAQFKKLGEKDKSLAFFKFNYPEDWMIFVEESMASAVNQMRRFGRVIERDRDSFLEFIGQTLAGDLMHSNDYHVLLGDKVIQFSKVMDRLKKSDVKVSTSRLSTANKESLLINLEVGSKRYCLTKIEPAFDGANPAVSQTKGVIYYFQQYPNQANNYKKLLIDVSK
jgi:hypothetical protein